VLRRRYPVVAAAQVPHGRDVKRMGRLMLQSYASLRDDFELSGPALNAMVEIAAAQPGCWGARMTGGGFGGCAVALVDRQAAAAVGARITTVYRERTGIQAAVYVCRAAGGAEARRG